MILTELVLDNFGLYRGRNVFDLRPRVRYRQERPVILFGGKNGAGKTTILEAINLCLYGPLAISGRPSRREYEDYLRQRIHRSPSAVMQPNEAQVELEFEYSEGGRKRLYRVVRVWVAQPGGGLRESLDVFSDGRPLDVISRDHWEDFLRELLPPGISRLFFFDGERVKELAEDDSAQDAFHRSLLGLLGLDLVDTLQGDLQTYLSRKRREGADSTLLHEIDSLEEGKKKAIDHTGELRQKVANLRGLFENAVSRQARIEDELRAEGSRLIAKRDELRDVQTRTAARLDELEQQARDLCAGVLPFSTAPDLLVKLRKQLLNESDARKRRVAGDLLKKELRSLKRLSPSAKIKGKAKLPTASATTQVVNYLMERLQEREVAELRHDLSPADERKLLGWIDSALDEAPGNARRLAGNIEKVVRQQKGTGRELDQVPEEELLSPKAKDLTEASEIVGNRRAELREAEEACTISEKNVQDIERQIRRIEERLEKSNQTELRISRAERTVRALEEFRDRLLRAKLAELEEAFTAAHRKLSRKGDLIQRITIKPETLEMILIDHHGRPIPQSQLSAGEKQIYAICMLWALGHASGRPLPVVVDTPLGRLDSDHRAGLVDRYFPHASHQVIVLSTDTEVDEHFFEGLRKHLSHAYHLVYDPVDERTVVQEGYFWNKQVEEGPLRAAQ